MRGIPIKVHISNVDGSLHAEEPSDRNASQWLDSVNLTGKKPEKLMVNMVLAQSLIKTERYLQDRQAAKFDFTNSRSFDLKFSSKLLLPGT